MADRLKPLMTHLMLPICLLLAATELCAQSGAVADPTRPPTAQGEAATSGAEVQDMAPVGLQTIIRRKGAKPMAVINGETVTLGGKVGESRVTKITETEVVLDGPAGREVLTMTPSVEKKPVVAKKATRKKHPAPAAPAKPKE